MTTQHQALEPPTLYHCEARVDLPADIAEKTASELERYPGQAERYLSEIKAVLDVDGSTCAS